MKREIKFRAWDGVKMRHFDLSDTIAPCGIEIMQFTGLSDKNGGDIFEGDIVKHFGQHDNEGVNSPCISICEVQYLDNMACFFPFSDLSWGSVYSEDYEIIGNIFENPELLEAVT